MHIIKRQGLFIYLYHSRDLGRVRKYGDIHYYSQRLRYVHLYVNQEDSTSTLEELSKAHFVKKVKISKYPELPYSFVGALES